MALDNPSLQSDVWERREARRRLQELASREHLATRWEAEKPGVIRTALAEAYRNVLGIHPSQREEYRDALERIAESGSMAVEDLIEILRQRYSSNGCGFSSAPG